MRGRGERSKVEELEDQVIRLRVLARRLWRTLSARTGLEAEALFDHDHDAMRVADPVYDAAETVWDRQRILIVPCRVILDPGGRASLLNGWPTQDEMYLVRWPDGSTRNLTRAQVLMMGGQDPDEGSPPPEREMPF